VTRRKGAVLPNLKLYRRTWLAAILFALISLIALRPTNAPELSADATAFDGRRAFADLVTVAGEYPNRTAGSRASNRVAVWISEQVDAIGLEPFVEPFETTIDGAGAALQNVWTISGRQSNKAIVLVANRDTAALVREGANQNASGVAALLELARIYSVERHGRSIIFLWTDGDSYGAVGTKAFLDAHPDLDIVAALSLSELATPEPQRVALDGWSASDNVAPPWLWATAESAGKAEARLPTPLPNIITQALHLAVPVGGGSHAAFVERGIPAIGISIDGRDLAPVDDTRRNVSRATLGRAGRAVERLVDTLDKQAGELPAAGPSLFFSRYRRLSGTAIRFALAVLLIPVLAVTIDLLAAARRRGATLGPAWLLYLVRVAPWIVMLIVVYLANGLGLLPGSPGSAIPPDSLVAQSPRYVRVLFLLALLVGVVFYAHAVERRLQRRTTVEPRNTVTVVHLVLLTTCLLVLLVNAFSLFLILPAAVLWPLARRGAWPASWAPAWGGLVGVVIALLYFATRFDLGIDVWWYFFLLLEDRTVPVMAALLGAAFVAAALHLGHHMHVPLKRHAPRLSAAPGDDASSTPAERRTERAAAAQRSGTVPPGPPPQ